MFSSWLVLFTSSPLQAQRSELNAKVRMLREELQHLQEQCSYVGEVVKPMDKKKVLVMVHPEGKLVVVFDKNIDMNDVTPNCRVALRNDSYTLHKILPKKVDPWNGEDSACPSCGPSHRVHLHQVMLCQLRVSRIIRMFLQSVRLRARPEVHRRGQQDGAGAVRDVG